MEGEGFRVYSSVKSLLSPLCFGCGCGLVNVGTREAANGTGEEHVAGG